MKSIPSSTPSAEPVLLDRHAAGNRQSRRWSGGANFSLLAAFVVIGCFLLYGRTPLQSALKTRPARVLTYNDAALRQLAFRAPRPEYPPASLANKVAGVVVAAVTIEVSGKTKNVQIIESPDTATAGAVRDAVMQWGFRPIDLPVPVDMISGTIIFYFHLMGRQGVVSSSEEIQAIRGGTPGEGQPNAQPTVRVIDEAEFRRLSGTLAPVILDTRSRAAYLEGHRDTAVGIPLSEFSARAGAELPRSRLIVIDCFAEQQHAGGCGMAAHVLASSGFSEVSILNRRFE